MYINGKMRPVVTILGMWGAGIKENDEGGEFNYDIMEELLCMLQCIPSKTIINK
jgi:hypothetical protein